MGARPHATSDSEAALEDLSPLLAQGSSLNPCLHILRKISPACCATAPPACPAVLEAALFWLHAAAEEWGEEAQRDAACRLLGRVRWGLLLPFAAVGAWQRSKFVRLADPHRRLALASLAVQLAPPNSAQQQAAQRLGLWQRRPLTKLRPIHATFEVRRALAGAVGHWVWRLASYACLGVPVCPS